MSEVEERVGHQTSVYHTEMLDNEIDSDSENTEDHPAD